MMVLMWWMCCVSRARPGRLHCAFPCAATQQCRMVWSDSSVTSPGTSSTWQLSLQDVVIFTCLHWHVSGSFDEIVDIPNKFAYCCVCTHIYLHVVSSARPMCCVVHVSEVCCAVSEMCCVVPVSEVCFVVQVSEVCCVVLVSEVCCVVQVSEVCCVVQVSEVCCVVQVSEVCCAGVRNMLSYIGIRSVLCRLQKCVVLCRYQKCVVLCRYQKCVVQVPGVVLCSAVVRSVLCRCQKCVVLCRYQKCVVQVSEMCCAGFRSVLCSAGFRSVLCRCQKCVVLCRLQKCVVLNRCRKWWPQTRCVCLSMAGSMPPQSRDPPAMWSALYLSALTFLSRYVSCDLVEDYY